MRRSKESVTRIVAVFAILLGSISVLAGTATAVSGSPLGGNVAMQTTTPAPCSTNGAGAGANETCLDIRIVSANPAVANTLGNPTTILLKEGSRTELNTSITNPNTLSLPRTFGLNNPSDFGTYTLTINAGSNFEPFSQTYTVNQADDQVLTATLQVDDTSELVAALVEKLKEILRDALATQTPTATATPVTPTSTPGGPTATATPVTPTATATATATATPEPPADFVSFNISANPASLQTGETTTFTATLSGRTGNAGAVLTLTALASNPAGVSLDEFACGPGCVAQDSNPATFNLGPNMNYTRTFTFEGTSETDDTYTVTVTAEDQTSNITSSRQVAVTFVEPTPTPVPPTATAVPPTATATATETTVEPPMTFTYQGENCGAANADGEQTCTAMFGQGETESVTCVSTPTVVCKGEFGDEVVDTYDCVYAAPTGTCTLRQA